MPQQTRSIIILLALSVGIAAAVYRKGRVSTPDSQARLIVLDDIVMRRSIAYTPYPIGYPEFAGAAIRAGVNSATKTVLVKDKQGAPVTVAAPSMRGLMAAQAGLYVLTVLFSYGTLCGLGLRGAAPVLGAAAVALYPNLFLGITKFQDTGVSIFLMSLFAWLVTRLKRQGLSASNAAIAGLSFGIILLVRPNAITLAPVAAWAAFQGCRFATRQIALLAVTVALAFSILAVVLLPLKGRLDVFDRYYGAYTFCNGTHEYALAGILHDYNGEMTMPRTFRELGLPFQGLERTNASLAAEYMRVGWAFIRDHPVRYAALEAVKVLNLFRPDYRNVDNSFAPRVVVVSVHTAIAGLFFIWVFLRWRCRRFIRFGDGLLLIPALVLYCVPFVMTNTDPRYRVPLDTLFIIESAYCASLLREKGQSRTIPLMPAVLSAPSTHDVPINAA